MIKLIKSKKSRKSLSEGRNFGFAFSILNKINSNTFEEVTPFTCCKDYFNDLIYVERTKQPLNQIYGFKHENINLLDNKRYLFLGVRILDYNYGNSWPRLKECNDLLMKNAENLIDTIVKFEDSFIKSKSRTTLISKDNDTLVLRLPLCWSRNSPLISLYTLFIRCYFDVKEEDLNKDITTLISKKTTCFISDDIYLMNTIKKFDSLELATKRKIYNYKYPTTNLPNSIHNNGIVSWLNLINKPK